MTGSEKADGYSRDAFVGLDECEKEIVFGLLLNELPFSAEWLFFVDPERAIAVMKEEERKLRENAYAHTYLIQEELVRRSGELIYQRHMLDDYENCADSLKPLVVSAVARTPQNRKTVDFFKQVILSEMNESAVARAAFQLLWALDVPCDTEEEKHHRDSIINELRSNDVDVKLRALTQLERYEVKLK